MAIIKLSIPGAPRDADISQYLGNQGNQLGRHKIFVNSDIDECDAWFVFDAPERPYEKCLVTQGCVVHLTAETLLAPGHYDRGSNRKMFLNQFDEIHTCHDVYRDNVSVTLPFLPWMVNANHGNSIWANHDRDIKRLLLIDNLPKSRNLSVICSAKASNPQHAMRLRFVQNLKNHFGPDLDWFGNGVRPISEKWSGLAPYKYSIVLENGSSPNIITEKLLDSYLALSYPIYWGAPNTNVYFPSESFTAIDIKDLKGSIAIIEKVLTEDRYNELLPFVRSARNLVLNDYMFLNRIARITERLTSANGRYGKRLISIRSTRRLGASSFSGITENTREVFGILFRRISNRSI